MNSRKKNTATNNQNAYIFPLDDKSPIIIPLDEKGMEDNTTISFHTEKKSTKNGVSRTSSTSAVMQIIKEPHNTRAKNGIVNKKRYHEDIIDIDEIKKEAFNEKLPLTKKARISKVNETLEKIDKELASVKQEINQLDNQSEPRDDTFEVFDQCFNQYKTPTSTPNRSPNSSGNLFSDFSLGYHSDSQPESPKITIYNYAGTINLFPVNKPSTPPQFLDEVAAKQADADFYQSIGIIDEFNYETDPFANRF